MKRTPELHGLSEDHHAALVLARKARLAGTQGDDGTLSPDEVWAEVKARFARDLEPHFAVEERVLAPLLEAKGESEPVARMLADHQALRDCLRNHAEGTKASLLHFGQLLEQHIRFEERELFALAEKVLKPHELDAIRRARPHSRER